MRVYVTLGASCTNERSLNCVANGNKCINSFFISSERNFGGIYCILHKSSHVLKMFFSVHHPQKKRRDNYFQMKILRKGIRWGKEQIVAIPSQRLSHKLLEIHYVIETIRQMFVCRRKNIWNDMISYSLRYS